MTLILNFLKLIKMNKTGLIDQILSFLGTLFFSYDLEIGKRRGLFSLKTAAPSNSSHNTGTRFGGLGASRLA